VKLVGLCLALAATLADADDSLIGLWSHETRYDHPLEGHLTINREGEHWYATIAGRVAEFEPSDHEIRFEFADGGGRYRGRLAADRIEGLWIRPGVTQDPRFPGGSSQPYATPVDLAPVSRGIWQGSVKPLPDRFTLYLRIFRNENGELTAAFRNPEQNSRGPASQFRVAHEGDTVHFTAGEEPAEPKHTLTAQRLAAPDRLRIRWDDVAADIELTRRTEHEAADFFPRAPGTAQYAYRMPQSTDDGWETVRASDVGIDEAAITTMIQGIANSNPAELGASLIHALLIARHGKLVVEEYFFGHDRSFTHDLRSAGKTFSSVLLGAIMRDTPVIGPDSKVYALLAMRGPFLNPDRRKADITLAHLMTHSAGLACNDYDDASPGNENTLQTQRRQPDWWKYTLDLPLAHDPGKRYAYCSANINLMGAVLTDWSKTWLPELFRREIAEPLLFGEWHWNLQPTDEGYLGGGAFLRPRDFLKVGQLYLNGGAWRGRRVVSPEWVKASTAPRMAITPQTTGLSLEAFGEAYFEGADALAWHLNPVRAGNRTYNAYAATGNGGQVLLVIPELDMTAVFTGGNYGQGGIWGRWGNRFIGGHIIPAIRKGEGQ
jgi:CubicO group peptidase (beta-lactamase class C family)